MCGPGKSDAYICELICCSSMITFILFTQVLMVLFVGCKTFPLVLVAYDWS